MTDPFLAISTPHGRYYKTDSRPIAVPSVTNIINQKNKPAIPRWAARTAAEYAVDSYDRLHALERDEAVKLIKDSPFGKSEASAIGDLVHGWVDGYIKTGVHPNNGDAIEYAGAPLTARRMWRQFEGFRDHYKPAFLDAEFTVWSDKYGYAGTADWSADLAGMLVLADTKTGKAAYPEVGMQLAALANADFILSSDGTEVPMPKWDRCAVLHLRPTFSRLIPVDHVDSCFRAFLGLKASFDHDVANGDSVLQYAPKIETQTAGV